MKNTIALLALLAGTGSALAAQPLSETQMDGVTAGRFFTAHFQPPTVGATNTATVVQVNASPVTVTQINAMQADGSAGNIATIVSGNFADITLAIEALALPH